MIPRVFQEDFGTTHRAFDSQPSPSLSAPSNSHRLTPTQHSLDSPSAEEHKELNPTRLVLSLMKLKRSPKYQDQPSDVVVEHSIDGSCRVYVTRPSQPSLRQLSPSNVQSPGARDGQWTPISTQTFLEKLRELAEARKHERHSANSHLEISLDNCTVIYYPEDCDTCEDGERVEVLPCSRGTPSDPKPYYSFSSRSTLRFITNALANSSPRRVPAEPPCESEVSTSDRSILYIQPTEVSGRCESEDQSTPVTSLRDEGSDIACACSAQQLMQKLEELKIPGEETAIDANITMIINRPSESSTPSGPPSGDLQTPLSKTQEVVDLMSPRTKWKLMRKLQDVQEVCEGEEEAKVPVGPRLFLPSSEGASHVSSQQSSVESPAHVRRFSPPHAAIVERLFQLQRDEDSSSED